jgi:hypothetical protein
MQSRTTRPGRAKKDVAWRNRVEGRSPDHGYNFFGARLQAGSSTLAATRNIGTRSRCGCGGSNKCIGCLPPRGRTCSERPAVPGPMPQRRSSQRRSSQRRSSPRRSSLRRSTQSGLRKAVFAGTILSSPVRCGHQASHSAGCLSAQRRPAPSRQPRCRSSARAACSLGSSLSAPPATRRVPLFLSGPPASFALQLVPQPGRAGRTMWRSARASAGSGTRSVQDACRTDAHGHVAQCLGQTLRLITEAAARCHSVGRSARASAGSGTRSGQDACRTDAHGHVAQCRPLAKPLAGSEAVLTR